MRTHRHLALVAAMTAIGATAVFPQERGACLTAEVPAPVVMPDGSVHDGGILRLCLTNHLSPVTGIHLVTLDGRSLGLFLSRIDRAEGLALSHPVMAFVRDGSGTLKLLGFAWPGEGRMRSFRFDRGSTPLDVTAVVKRLSVAEDEDAAPVWLAAR